MSSQLSDTILDCGVDYLTAVYKGSRSGNDLASFGRYLVHDQERQGEKLLNFRFSGYRGESCGQASWGVRWDSQILRLSSGCAAEYWNQAYNLATNITRVDLQVTVLPGEGPQKRLAGHHREMLAAKRGRGKPREFKFWYGPHGPESAVFGSRKSDYMNRAYDKGLESGLAEWAGALRYESELHRALALRSCERLDQSENSQAAIATMVPEFLAKSGKAFAKYFSQGQTLGGISSAPHFPESNIGLVNSGQGFSEPASIYKGGLRSRRFATFLSMSVKPGVHRLLDQGRSEEVLEALGLCIENGRLVKAQSQTWADFKKWR